MGYGGNMKGSRLVDVLDDKLPDREFWEKIFNKMQKIHNDGGLLFFQRRMKPIKIGATEYDDAEVIQGYEYIVMRGKK